MKLLHDVSSVLNDFVEGAVYFGVFDFGLQTFAEAHHFFEEVHLLFREANYYYNPWFKFSNILCALL
jgi:hypothetical protein